MAYFIKPVSEQLGFGGTLDAIMGYDDLLSGLNFISPVSAKPVVNLAENTAMTSPDANRTQTITIYSPITSFDLGDLDGNNGFFINGINEFDVSGIFCIRCRGYQWRRY